MFPQEEIKERYNNLPQHMKDFMFSEDNASAFWEAGEANHISEEKLKIISELIGYVILGLIRPEDFTKKLEEVAGLDHRVSPIINEVVMNQVLAPIMTDIQNLYYASPQGTKKGIDLKTGLLTPAFKGDQRTREELLPNGTPEPLIESPKPQEATVPTPSATSVPKFTRPTTQATPPPQPSSEGTVDAGSQPRMLHEAKDITPISSGGMAPLARPHFFKSTAGEKQKEKPITARLEIGQKKEAPQEPEIGRTKKEEVRVVDYTSPSMETNPFEKLPQALVQNSGEKKEDEPAQEKPQPNADEPQAQKEEPAEEISSDNIVNLKDLPK